MLLKGAVARGRQPLAIWGALWLPVREMNAFSYLLPRFDGAILSQEWKQALWGQVCHGSATSTHAGRAAMMRAGPPSVRGSARMIASFARDVEQRAGDQPENGGEVAQAPDGRGPQDGAKGTTLDDPDRGGGGDRCRFAAANAAAAGRLPPCAAAIHPAPDAFIAASVPAAPSHRGATGSSPMANTFHGCLTWEATSRSGRS